MAISGSDHLVPATVPREDDHGYGDPADVPGPDMVSATRPTPTPAPAAATIASTTPAPGNAGPGPEAISNLSRNVITVALGLGILVGILVRGPSPCPPT